MTLKEYLEKHPIINKAELARLMWPNVKGSAVRLNNKLKEVVSGNSIQRITERDQAIAKQILKKLGHDAEEL